jgi:pilus assembly protein Flp/PilA
MERIKRFFREEEGAALVEYGLLVGLIAAVCIAVVTTLGTTIKGMFATLSTTLGAVP